MAYYVIHPTPGLGEADYRRAVRMGPYEVGSRRTSEQLLRAAGFRDITQVDVTETFHKTCASVIAAEERYADQLRPLQGETAFEEGRLRKKDHLVALEARLLRRSLVFGRRP